MTPVRDPKSTGVVPLRGATTIGRMAEEELGRRLGGARPGGLDCGRH